MFRQDPVRVEGSEHEGTRPAAHPSVIRGYPWDTIRMVPTPTVAADQTSLDSQSNR